MAASAKTSNILVVDDDVDTCRNLSDILTDLGYHVDIAHDGLAALELVRKKPYDVALLDFKMPGMDGLTLYREIKKLRAGTVAVIVTAYAGGDTVEAARAAGAWQVLPKPVDFPKLLGLVNEALEQPLVMVVDDDQDLCSNLWDLFRGPYAASGQDAVEPRAATQVQHRFARMELAKRQRVAHTGKRLSHCNGQTIDLARVIAQPLRARSPDRKSLFAVRRGRDFCETLLHHRPDFFG
jgi:CheY-like chemotaxis protein